MDTGRPYIEEGEIRKFSHSTPEEEFVWHRDKEDRYIETLHETDWKVQLDNELPTTLSSSELFIPKETYHRVIKGTGDLTVKIRKVYT